MTDHRPDHDDSGRDDERRLEDALRDLQAAHAVDGPGPGLRERILAAAAQAHQRRWLASVPTPWSGAWPRTAGPAIPAATSALALVAVAVVAVVGMVLVAGRGPSATPTQRASVLSSAPATDVPASAEPHQAGTCPETQTTRLAGGLAPEVDVSGLRWRWGGVPWVAGVPEKVVWLADAGPEPAAGVSVDAVQLDLPILVNGHPVAFPAADATAIYAAATDAGWVADLQLPQPGCWLLTATWSHGASSVVVAASPAPGTASPGPSTTVATVSSTPLVACPATQPSTSPPPQGWSGPAVVDGPFRWLLPLGTTWRFGGDGDKLVLDSGVGWEIGDMRIVAIPLVHATGVGWLGGSAVAGDIPPGFGGGTMGFGLTLPRRDCWAFAFVETAGTSTIVDDLATGASAPSPTTDAAMALEVASSYETALSAGDWSTAWALLSQQSQATVGSLGAFETLALAYNAQGGMAFELQEPTQDTALVANFLGASQAAIASVADVSRGYLVFAQHPNVQAASAGTTGLYIAPLRAGDWRIWLVH